MAEAKASPEPAEDSMWTDIYVEGTEPKYIRGVEPTQIIQFGSQ